VTVLARAVIEVLRKLHHHDLKPCPPAMLLGLDTAFWAYFTT